MIRVAFTLVDGKNWTGGYNYLLNLVSLLAKCQADRVKPVLFFGTDATEDEIAPFAAITGVEIVCSPLMNQIEMSNAIWRTLLWGVNTPVINLFKYHQINVVFEAAQFFGWRLKLPVIGWIADFQHRTMPHMFSPQAYWKRELGYRTQIASGRAILLSSEDAQQACHKYYPVTKGRTRVIRFAIPPKETLSSNEARTIANGYGLPEQFFFLPNQFWQHKNHMLVLDALALLRKNGHSMVIAASGKQIDPRNPLYFSQVQQRVTQLGLESEFRLLGLIPYSHVTALMQVSMALLNPSRSEGWSTTVEEARSLGVPMLLSDLPVHREQAGEHACYFDVSSALSLATLLQQFQPLKLSQREERVTTARKDALLRTQLFAEQFVLLVEYSIEHSLGKR